MLAAIAMLAVGCKDEKCKCTIKLLDDNGKTVSKETKTYNKTKMEDYNYSCKKLQSELEEDVLSSSSSSRVARSDYYDDYDYYDYGYGDYGYGDGDYGYGDGDYSGYAGFSDAEVSCKSN